MEETAWREYRNRLFSFVLRRVGEEAMAEDIVQDVLVRAYSRRDSLRDAERFEAWLYQIARNAVTDYYRVKRPSEPIPPDLASPDRPYGDGAMRELATCMQPLIQALPEKYRAALVLAELEGLTQLETAGRLGLSLPGAKSRVQRGRRLLAEKLLDCCRVELDGRGSIVDYEPRKGRVPGGDGNGCGRC